MKRCLVFPILLFKVTVPTKIEKNNRMGKSRDLFKKIRDTKGVFHAKRGTIKDRNGMDLTARKFRKFSRSVVSDSLRPHVL